MESYDGDAAELLVAKNPVATRLASTLLERGLEMAETEGPNRETFLEKCFEFLVEQGYRPKTDGQNIDFKKEGVAYHIIFLEPSRSVAQILTIERYEKSDLNRFDALELANGINGIIDAHVSVLKDDDVDYTWISFTSTCHYPDFFEESFDDRLNAIQQIIHLFKKGLLDQET